MTERFTKFTMSVSKLHRLIQKMKTGGMGEFGLKAVDTLCLYQLAEAGELSFAELSERCDSDGALLSRTLAGLVKNGMVEKLGAPGKYKARYRLTARGAERTAKIRAIISKVQERADKGISPEELAIFYQVLGQLTRNFEEMTREGPLFYEQVLKEAGVHQEGTV